MTQPDPALARTARTIHTATRAQFLLDVSTRTSPPPSDMPWHVCEPGNQALLPMSIVTYIRAVPGWGDTTARRLVAALAGMLTDATHDPFAPRDGKTRSPHARRRPTFSWLVDARAQGRRVLAWLALTHPRTPPWPGWPVNPDPRKAPTDER